MVALVKIGVGMGIVEEGCDMITGKVGGKETGMETGGGEGALERICTSGLGDRGGVSPRTETASSELPLSDALGVGGLCLIGIYSGSKSLDD